MKLSFGLIVFVLATAASAQTFTFSPEITDQDKAILSGGLSEALRLLPLKMREGLPSKINIKLSGDAKSVMPDVCEAGVKSEGSSSKFTYGRYMNLDKSLTINRALVRELGLGESASKKITCRHGSLYDEAMATMVHELTHAYDMNNGSPSGSKEFANIAGFKDAIVHTFKKNSDPMRSPDEYEFKNTEESFAVNMEYFVMDSEFYCRRPVMFAYYKKLLGVDPHPQRSCKVNRSVMLLTQMGLMPTEIEPSRVYRIDYLMAAPGSDMSSGFGHSMYRIIVCAPTHTDLNGEKVEATPVGEKCLKDKLYHLIVSYRANNQDAKLNYLKGIYGGYPSQLFIMSFSDVLDEYTRTELRDVTSYPMKFSKTEKEDFLNRIAEEHWGYRGTYRFVTNNCATESLRVVKNIVTDRRDERKLAPRLLPTLTPVGFRHLLATSGLLDEKDPGIEVYKAKTDYLIASYTLAYGYKKKSERDDNKALVAFIENSKPEDRMAKFHAGISSEKKGAISREKLVSNKGLIVQLASFSLLEQQIIRGKVEILKKKLAEMTNDKKALKERPELAFLKKSEKNRAGIETSTHKGYGIPAADELVSLEEVQKSMSDLQASLEKSDELLQSLFPVETRELIELSNNLKEMNTSALVLRKNFKGELDQYLVESIHALAPGALGSGSGKVLVKNVRKVLGEELITEKEVADEKILQLLGK